MSRRSSARLLAVLLAAAAMALSTAATATASPPPDGTRPAPPPPADAAAPTTGTPPPLCTMPHLVPEPEPCVAPTGSPLSLPVPVDPGPKPEEGTPPAADSTAPPAPQAPPAEAYAAELKVFVEPAYDITISAVTMTFLSGCDPFSGPSDPTVFWVDANGAQHRRDLYLSAGIRLDMDAFAGTWTAVRTGDGLTMPTLEWVDRDPVGFGSVGENALPRGPQLLPFPDPPGEAATRRIGYWLHDGGGDDCEAYFDYTITYRPRV